MRKVLTSMVATLVLFGALLVFSGVATAGKPTAITFNWDLVQGPFVKDQPMRFINTGTWSASGVVSDSGDVVEIGQLRPPKPGITKVTLTSAQGTITIRGVGQTMTVISPDPFTIQFGGIWRVAGGTGAYRQLSGHGTMVVTVNVDAGLNTATLTGTGHLPP